MSEQLTIFLSKLHLNPRGPAMQRALENCHVFHQSIMRGFPTVDEASPRKTLDVLYRPEIDLRLHTIQVLVQSTIRPDWRLLSGGEQPFLATGGGELPVKSVDEYYAAIAVGDRLRFRLRANPTRRLLAVNADRTPKVDANGRREMGKRVHLLREEEQLAWLERKGDLGGFRVETVLVQPDRFGSKRQVGWRGERQPDHEREIQLDAVLFDGELTVIDAERFRETLMAGIGSGKSYGCGLLSVAPRR